MNWFINCQKTYQLIELIDQLYNAYDLTQRVLDGHAEYGAMLEAGVLIDAGIEAIVLVGIGHIHCLAGGGHMASNANVDRETGFVGAGTWIGLVVAQIVRLEVKDTREAALVCLVNEQNLDTLALDETLHVGEYAEDHVLYGALLLEDHACQIQQHLISLNFQLRFLKKLRIAQANATELQIRGKDLKQQEKEKKIYI